MYSSSRGNRNPPGFPDPDLSSSPRNDASPHNRRIQEDLRESWFRHDFLISYLFLTVHIMALLDSSGNWISVQISSVCLSPPPRWLFKGITFTWWKSRRFSSIKYPLVIRIVNDDIWFVFVLIGSWGEHIVVVVGMRFMILVEREREMKVK